MKIITAMIQPFMLNKVTSALEAIADFPGMTVTDEKAQQIVETLVRVAHTGNSGDGKVFVWSVENAVRIQTGEQNEAAL
jgi:nitrogen regulatory protein PII